MVAPVGPRVTPLPSTAAPQRFDLSTLTATQLKNLKTSQPQVAALITSAQSTWAKQLAAKPPARVLVTTSAGNGGQPLLVIVPPGFDPKKPVTVQTHYHGDRTSAAAATGSHTLRIKERLVSDPQTLWVLPEARGNINANGTDWSNVSNQKLTTADALSAAGVTSVARKVVSVHSAGGRALAAAMANKSVDADQVRLLDCLFEAPNGPGAYSNILKALPTLACKDLVLVATGSYPASRDAALLKAAGARAHQVKLVRAAGFSDHEAACRMLL